MAVEDDILSTLKRIEQALSRGTTVAGLGRAPSAPSPAAAGTRRPGNTDARDSRADAANARKMEAAANKQQNAADRNLDAAKRLQTVADRLMAATSRRASATTRRGGGDEDSKSFQAVSTEFEALGETTTTLNRNFLGLSKTVYNTRASFIEMNRSMRASTRGAPARPAIQSQAAEPVLDTGGPAGPTPPAPNPAAQGGLLANAVAGALRTIFPRLGGAGGAGGGGAGGGTPGGLPFGGGGGNRSIITLIRVLGGGGGGGHGSLSAALNGMAGRVNVTSLGLGFALKELAGAIKPLIRDIFLLHSVGIQASSALGSMYYDAARFGMSLADYTKVVQESSVAVTRTSSMSAFGDELAKTRAQLAGLGIFGAEATRLAASLATSATTLGVPQAQLADATSAQVKVFEHLRKTSLLTADGFQQLTAELANNQDVQSELLGLSSSERSARFAELTAIRGIGLEMGATAAASDALGRALIAQRELTVPKRFEARARILQAGAALGQDSSRSAELADLQLKRNRTVDEQRRYVELSSELEGLRQEGMNDDGNFGRQNVAEHMGEYLSQAGILQAAQAAGNATLTTQSGPAGVNKDFASGSSMLLKAAGALNDWATGIGQNGVATAVISGITSAATSMLMSRAFSTLLPRLLGRGGARAAAAAGGAGGLGGGLGGAAGAGGAGGGGLGGRLGGRPPRGGSPAPANPLGNRIPTQTGGLRGGARAVSEALQEGFGAMRSMLSWRGLVPRIAGIGAAIAGASSLLWSGVTTGFEMVRNAGRWINSIGLDIFKSMFQGLLDGFNFLRNLGPSMVSGMKSFFQMTADSAKVGIDVVRNGGTMREVSTGILDGVKGFFSGTFGKAFGGIAEFIERDGLKAMVPGLKKGLMTAVKSSLQIVGDMSGLNAIFAGVFEIFTGDVENALNSTSNETWFGNGFSGFATRLIDKFTSVVGAAFRGIVTGVTDLMDLGVKGLVGLWNNTVGKIFDSLTISFDFGFTNFFDKIWTMAAIWMKEIRSNIYRKLGFTSWADDVDKDIVVAKKSLETLRDDSSKTLEDIGSDNQDLIKQQKEAADKTSDSVKTATTNIKASAAVLNDTKDLTSILLSQSPGFAGTTQDKAVTGGSTPTTPPADVTTPGTQAPAPIAAPTTTPAPSPAPIAAPATPPVNMIAMPGQTIRSGVVDPAVNNPSTTPTGEAAPAPAPGTPAPPAATPMDTLIAQVVAMNTLLGQMLTAEQAQAAGIESLNRAAGRPAFSDNETSFKLLNGLFG